MKYLKVLAPVAVAAVILLAVAGAGSASATELTCTEPAGTVMCPAGTVIRAESEGKTTLHPPIGDIECDVSNVAGKTSNTGTSSETVEISLESVVFKQCNAEITTLRPGKWIVHTTETNVNNDGTLTWTGLELTTTFAGFHCIFSTNETDIGNLTGSSTTKSAATLDIKATIPRTGGRSGAFCGSTAQWTGSYIFTTPTALDVT